MATKNKIYLGKNKSDYSTGTNLLFAIGENPKDPSGTIDGDRAYIGVPAELYCESYKNMGEKLADYVVQQGHMTTSDGGEWTWTTWASGFKEMWFYKKFTTADRSADRNGFSPMTSYTQYYTRSYCYNIGNYPVAFSSSAMPPISIAQCQMQTGGLEYGGNITQCLAGVTNTSGGTLIASCDARGNYNDGGSYSVRNHQDCIITAYYVGV